MNEVQVFLFDGQIPEANGDPAVQGLEGHVYVVEFGDFGIKVGRSDNPGQRITQHVRDGKNFGRPVSRIAVSPAHIEFASNEQSLIRLCGGRCSGERQTEYLAASFDAAVVFLRSLPMNRADVEAFKARCESTLQTFKAIALGDYPATRSLPARETQAVCSSDPPRHNVTAPELSELVTKTAVAIAREILPVVVEAAIQAAIKFQETASVTPCQQPPRHSS